MTPDLAQCPDCDLAALALSGRQDAYREFLVRYKAPVFRLIRGHVGDEGEAGLAAGAILVAVGAVMFAVGALISQAMRSVFGVALYRYASTGTASATFSEEELRSAVRTK